MQVVKNQMQPQSAPMTLKPPMSWRMKFFLILILVIFGIFVFGATMLAKTGLVHVPLLSNVVTSIATPSRVVVIPPGTPTVEETFKTQFQGAVARYARSRDEQDRQVQIRVSEASIAKSFQAALPSIKDKIDGATIEYAQLAVEAEGMELYVKMKRDGTEGVTNTLLATFTVDVKDGKPVFKIHKLRLGTLPLPSFALNIVSKMFADGGMDQLLQSISAAGTLNSVELRRGLLIVNGTLSSGVVNGR